jgi:predicted N-acetyltransferase YhbS
MQIYRHILSSLGRELVIRPMVEADIDEADRVLRLAFGVFLGLPEPETFRGDSLVVRPRWLLDPSAAYVAEAGGKILGSVFAANWGSISFVGPITVRPDLWDHGIGRFLMEPVTDLLDSWGSKLAGLVTYPQSPKHVAFYQKFDFWPRSLSVIMSRVVTQSPRLGQGALFSLLPEEQKQTCLDDIRDLTGSIYPGLDLTNEIRIVDTQHFGDTVLMWDGGRLEGMAVCHIGAGTEAGGGNCYVKFGAVRSGPAADRSFASLLEICGCLGAAHGATQLVAGVNTSRREAYGAMLGHSFKIERLNVAMHRPDERGYSRPGVFVMDDWQ